MKQLCPSDSQWVSGLGADRVAFVDIFADANSDFAVLKGANQDTLNLNARSDADCSKHFSPQCHIEKNTTLCNAPKSISDCKCGAILAFLRLQVLISRQTARLTADRAAS